MIWRIFSMELDLFKLWLFWEKYSVGNKLTTTGMRKLALLCVGWNGKNRKNTYPPYPLWDQPQVIREVVIAMLRTHMMGRELIDELILWNKCLGKLSKSELPETEDERKMMGKIIEDIFDFIEKVDSLDKS